MTSPERLRVDGLRPLARWTSIRIADNLSPRLVQGVTYLLFKGSSILFLGGLWCLHLYRASRRAPHAASVPLANFQLVDIDAIATLHTRGVSGGGLSLVVSPYFIRAIPLRQACALTCAVD